MIHALSLLGSAVGAALPLQAPQAVEKAATDFGAILGQVSSGAVDSLKAGEAAAISGVEGKVPVQQVVEAVMNAEQSLHAAIAIRDKAVSAYQALTQMAI
jgi:Flagellar hook-basal body protein